MQLILASEIKGMLADPSVPRAQMRARNERLIYKYLVTGYLSQVEDSFFQEIKEMTAAHYIAIWKDQIKIRKYF